jgi:SPP1 family predicted phage head-tail adaptor
MKVTATKHLNQKIRIGDMRERVKVQTYSEARDARGAVIATWTDLRTDFAAIDYVMTGNDEAIEGNQIVVFQRVRFTFRYRTGLSEKMRFVYDIDGTGEKIYDPMYHEVLGSRRFIRFTCEQRT